MEKEYRVSTSVPSKSHPGTQNMGPSIIVVAHSADGAASKVTQMGHEVNKYFRPTRTDGKYD